jgi:hypothetical protein
MSRPAEDTYCLELMPSPLQETRQGKKRTRIFGIEEWAELYYNIGAADTILWNPYCRRQRGMKAQTCVRCLVNIYLLLYWPFYSF